MGEATVGVDNSSVFLGDLGGDDDLGGGGGLDIVDDQ